MDTNKPIAGLSVLVAGVLIAGAAVISGGGVWYLQRRATLAAEARISDAQAESRRLQRRTRDLESQLASVSAALQRRSSEPVNDADREEPQDAEKPAAEDSRNIGFVIGVERTGSQTSLVLDYAEMLTGDAAVEAHKADGLGEIDGEQYYIRNVNPKKRTVSLGKDAKVVVWSWFAETEDIKAKQIPLTEYLASMPGGTAADEMRSRLPYWFTVSGDEVVRIEEQFIP